MPITGAARAPVFYESMGVPDTVLGRFEMISIHLILYLRRTGKAGDASRALAQDIVDAFFEDVDHSIRELGIGDMGVPKRMKKLARMFYGRVQSYGQAVDAGDQAGPHRCAQAQSSSPKAVTPHRRCRRSPTG
jgi:cytochrome b pre-mRNA-processing protein 3